MASLMKTTEYFNMSADKLCKIYKECPAFTVEMHKITEEGMPVSLFQNIEEYEQTRNSRIESMRRIFSNLKIKAELITVNGNVVIIFTE